MLVVILCQLLNWVWQKVMVGNFMGIFYLFCNILKPLLACHILAKVQNDKNIFLFSTWTKKKMFAVQFPNHLFPIYFIEIQFVPTTKMETVFMLLLTNEKNFRTFLQLLPGLVVLKLFISHIGIKNWNKTNFYRVHSSPSLKFRNTGLITYSCQYGRSI